MCTDLRAGLSENFKTIVTEANTSLASQLMEAQVSTGAETGNESLVRLQAAVLGAAEGGGKGKKRGGMVSDLSSLQTQVKTLATQKQVDTMLKELQAVKGMMHVSAAEIKARRKKKKEEEEEAEAHRKKEKEEEEAEAHRRKKEKKGEEEEAEAHRKKGEVEEEAEPRGQKPAGASWGYPGWAKGGPRPWWYGGMMGEQAEEGARRKKGGVEEAEAHDQKWGSMGPPAWYVGMMGPAGAVPYGGGMMGPPGGAVPYGGV